MKSHESYFFKTRNIVKYYMWIFLFGIFSLHQANASNLDLPQKNIYVEDNQPLSFEILPNPVVLENNNIDVDMEIKGIDRGYSVQILLYNTIGNLVYRMDLSVDSHQVHFKFKPKTNVSEGLYFISVLNGTNRVTRRMVVNSH
ncbi:MULTISPECIES: hypothetical protein [Flammeovirga]|uniref:Secretion system C-terminal sorting domain-containing protein n=1 Tax=Flammeovirga agarivorans TaxID=2726742 RepID=A0A7X8XXI0_9BACT|nr:MULTISPECIES: hypothetical protein [Flammeovirga]NLR93183.1 hypothetical protein [Flammeovirga agarivorans]